jgi:hypothetical protein
VPQATALLLTLAVEVPLYVAALVALRLAPFRRALPLAMAVNLLTHPVLWWTLGDRPPVLRIAAAEVLVWLVEAALLGLALRRRPALTGPTARRHLAVIALVAAGANAGSILAGAIIAAAA